MCMYSDFVDLVIEKRTQLQFGEKYVLSPYGFDTSFTIVKDMEKDASAQILHKNDAADLLKAHADFL